MKKITTLIAIALGINTVQAQITVADFETFTLSANSFYKDTNNTPFITSNASFQHKWSKGQYASWSAGFAYTNKYDSITPGYTNLYGLRAYKGYNNSSNYVVAQDRGVIKLLSTSQNTVDGFYITNTTYAYKSMKSGDQFAKKFGGTSGNDPDYFKVTTKGYKNGTLKTDSVEFYLADYRSSNNSLDYIVNNWQWLNTSGLGAVDSIKFFMYSSDFNSFGMNTPAFFGIDNFTTSGLITSLAKNSAGSDLNIFPNPFNSILTISNKFKSAEVSIINVSGQIVFSTLIDETDRNIDLSSLQSGMYFIEIKSDEQKTIKKIIKN